MAATTTPVTVAEYVGIADLREGRVELHHGAVVRVPPPKPEHNHVARNLFVALLERCASLLYVDKEFPYRPRPEYELWVADVAGVRQERWGKEQRRDWLAGSPELVIEILSPSNTAQELNDRESTSFEGGCLEFWTVDTRLRTVRVSTPDGLARTYAMGETIGLGQFGGAGLAIAEIFAD